MLARALALLALLLPLPAFAQSTAQVVGACGTPNSTYNVGQTVPLTIDTAGHLCGGGGGGGSSALPTIPFQQTGAGSLSVSTSATVTSMTVSYGAKPGAWTNLVVVDNGSSDVAVCVQGGTCTCAENSVASTNGTTIKAGGGGYQFNWASIAVATPTIVSCTGSATAVDFVF